MMKFSKMLLTLSFSFLCMLIMTFSVYAEENINGVSLADNVNIRETPETDSKVLGQLTIGETAQILSNKNNWYLIKTSSGSEGWVLNDLVAVDEEKDPIKRGMIVTDILNVRKEPSTQSNIIHTLSKENKVVISRSQDEWYEIPISETKNGWIHSDYVKIKPNYSKGKIIGDNVHLRKGNSLESEVVKELSVDTYIYVKNYSDGWYQISTFDGENGWVHNELVSILFENVANTVSRSTNRTSLKIVGEAKKLLGSPYKYGATGPNKFDCSGFTQYVFKKSGIKIPRTSRTQATAGKQVSKSDLQTGDLVFFNRNGKGTYITHVGIYLGNGQFIHASSGSKYSVIISDITTGSYNKRYVTARRVY